MLDTLVRLVESGHSWLIECTSLFLIPFAHEDVAILSGSLMVVEHRLPASLALMSLYAGIVSSDFLLYGLGVLAQRSRLARRLLFRPRIERLGQWLGNHAVSMVALARFVPGLMFPVYVGCGLYRISFTRFALTTTLTAAIYLPTLLFLMSRFGEAVLSHIGYWSWIVAVGLLTIAAVGWVRSPNWQLLLRVSTSGTRAFLKRVSVVFNAPNHISHRGMPALGALPTKVALAERIPSGLFYIPLGIQWLWLSLRHGSLSLPTLANPKIEVGGLWGESKTSCLDMVSPDQHRWIADYTTLRRGHGTVAAELDARRFLQAATAAGLSFPLVAKPDIGWRGFGVRLIGNAAELSAYVHAFPEDEAILLQRVIDFEGEAGVLYVRLPGSSTGNIVSLTFRYFPYVIGDGQRSIRDLILADQRAAWKAGQHFGFEATHLGTAIGDLDRVPASGETVRLSFIGSNRVGGLYRDAREHITPELVRRFDEISQSMPEFYYGRYDVRFASIERFRQGEDFQIIEINGAGGESINVWDPTMPLLQVYRELFAQQRLLFEIGAKNRARGYRPSGSVAILRSQWRQHRLILRYPPSS
jgi:membrane protein DedA with SNARE-associated domain